MLGANEFLSQIVPLFIQLIGVPVVLGVTYFGYKRYKGINNTKTDTTIEQTAIEQASKAEPHTIPDEEHENVIIQTRMEDTTMTDNSQPIPEEQKPDTRSKKIDTSDLPPLDLLLGNLEEEKSPEPEPTPPPEPDAPPQVVQLRQMNPGTAYVQLNTGQIAPAQEIISILRDDDDGRLVIQVGNTAYRTLADDADIKQLFTQIMKELAGTITQPDNNPPVRQRYVVGELPTDEPVFQQAPDLTPPIQSSMPSIRDLLVDDDTLESEPPAPQPSRTKPKTKTPPLPKHGGPMPGDLPSFKLDDNPLKTEKKGRFGGQKIEAEPLPELDLAAAIETYLQYKLQHTPDYIGRKIHIHGTPSGSIRIQVDENYYDFVDEVTDVEVRQFLQDTIAEWQERQ